MPLSEVHRTATRKELENSQARMTNHLSDLSSFMPDNEFVELLWENGQIVVQGQSNRPKKSSFTSNASTQTGKAHNKDGNVKMGRFSTMDQVVDEVSPTVPSVMGLNTQEDDNDNGPWMNYPIEDPLVQSDFCSEFLSEFSGVDLNSVATNANGNSNVVATTTTERITGFGFGRASQNIQVGNASRGITGGSESSSRIRKSQLFHLPQQCQSAIPNSKPKEAAEFRNHGSTSSHRGSSGDGGLLPKTGSQKQQDTANTKVPQASSGSGGGAGLMNFSHFSRAASLFKANLQGSDRLRSNEKTSTAGRSNPLESSLINSNSGFKSISGAIQGKPASTLLHDVAPRSSTKSTQDVASVQRAEAHKNHGKIALASCSRPSDQSKGQSRGLFGRQETEKAPEPAVASSVCSGNSVGAASNDPKYRAGKRKCREGEECEYQSDDVEDDSVGLKKSATAHGTSAKRTRAAEVHNLSERRRRDRINERMRALQELIPNCNKVDKASMLDEAIEYLKTLQLQVQIMSMGTGLCMPPMMMPPAMQHIRAASMYSPMGVGMGMGIGMRMGIGMGTGYGMGMVDMNGSPSLHGMPGGSAGLQMFGIPGQALPISMPQLPQYTSYSTLAMKPNTMGERSGAAGATCPVSAAPPVVDTAPSSSSKDLPHLNMNSEAPHQTKADDSPIPTSSIQALNEQSVVSQMSDHTLHVSGNSTTNSIRENDSGAP